VKYRKKNLKALNCFESLHATRIADANNEASAVTMLIKRQTLTIVTSIGFRTNVEFQNVLFPSNEPEQNNQLHLVYCASKRPPSFRIFPTAKSSTRSILFHWMKSPQEISTKAEQQDQGNAPRRPKQTFPPELSRLDCSSYPILIYSGLLFVHSFEGGKRNLSVHCNNDRLF
jgi:hypothetical protein